MKNKKFKIGLVVTLACLILLSLTACGPTQEVQQQLVEVSKGNLIVSVSADGNLSLPVHRRLTFGTSGTVATVNVEEGRKTIDTMVFYARCRNHD